MLADALFRSRDWVAVFPAALVLSALLGVSLQQLVKIREDDSVLAVTLVEEEAPSPPQPVPPPPRVRDEPVQPARERAVPQAEPVDTRPIEPTAPPREVIPPPPRELAPPPPTPTPAPAREPPPAIAYASLETAYVARLRAYLDSIKRYPTSREARSQRPQGKVRLWLEIARDGQLREAGIEQSSGSMILDGAAQSTARQGSYPAFPSDVFGGKASHRFTVTLDYQLEGG